MMHYTIKNILHFEKSEFSADVVHYIVYDWHTQKERERVYKNINYTIEMSIGGWLLIK